MEIGRWRDRITRAKQMGLDLRLLPFDCDRGEFAYSHTILNLDDRGVYACIEELNQLPVPENFTSFTGKQPNYDDRCYGPTTDTPYGERLTYTTAGELCSIPLERRSEYWRPTWAYLEALPPETKIALFWH